MRSTRRRISTSLEILGCLSRGRDAFSTIAPAEASSSLDPLCRFLAICRTATTSDDTERLSDEVHEFVHSDLALFKVHQTTVNLQRASAESNVDTLKQKQDDLQGQIRVSYQLLQLSVHMMSSSIFQSSEIVQGVEDQIQQKKIELQESKVHKQHQEEYELLKGMINMYPKRSESRRAIDKVEADIVCLQQESQRLDRTLAVRTHFAVHRTCTRADPYGPANSPLVTIWTCQLTACHTCPSTTPLCS